MTKVRFSEEFKQYAAAGRVRTAVLHEARKCLENPGRFRTYYNLRRTRPILLFPSVVMEEALLNFVTFVRVVDAPEAL